MRYKNAQQMIFDAYQESCGSSMGGANEIARLGTRVQTSQKGNNDWEIVHGLEAGAVISRVEMLPLSHAALLRYCFGPFSREELVEDAEIVQLALYRQLFLEGVRLPGQGKGKPTAEQLLVLRYLCSASLYHHSETTWPYSRKGLPTPTSIKQWLKDLHGITIDVRYWSKRDRITWSAPWKSLLGFLESWEKNALGEVSELISGTA